MPTDGTEEGNASSNMSDNAVNNTPHQIWTLLHTLRQKTQKQQLSHGVNGARVLSANLRFFQITHTARRRVRCLRIYGGDEIEKLLNVLPAIPDTDITLPSGESLNDFHRAIAKLDAHFTPMQNKTLPERSLTLWNKVNCQWPSITLLSENKEKSVFSLIRMMKSVQKYYNEWREITLWSHAEELYFEHIIEKRSKQRGGCRAPSHQYRESGSSRCCKQSVWTEKTCHPFKKFSKQATETGKKKHRKSAGEKPKQSASESHNQNRRKKNCSYCWMSHPGPRSKCPASGQMCVTCKGDWRDYLIYCVWFDSTDECMYCDLVVLEEEILCFESVMIWSGKSGPWWCRRNKRNGKFTSSFVTNWGLVARIWTVNIRVSDIEQQHHWILDICCNFRLCMTVFWRQQLQNVWSRGIREETTTRDLWYF